MASKHLLLCIGLWLLAGPGVAAVTGAAPQGEPQTQPKQVTTEIPYRQGKVVLTSDSQETVGKKHFARGNVRIAYQDILITCDAAEYDEDTQEGSATGPTRFSQGSQWLTCSRAEFNVEKQTATFYDAAGRTDQEFLIQGRTVLKTGRETYVVERGSLTACEEKRPKWSFDVGDARIRVDQTARVRRVVFKIKGLPVFYFPYLIVPMENKKRSSGFQPFHTGNSTSKGRQFSLGYFQTLGPSADIMMYGNYFSLRGLGIGGEFRARPDDQTNIDIVGFGVNDRLGQGGALLVVNGRSRFKNGFRTVASVNITTDFRFRQAFSDEFRTATVPQELSILFATRNDDSLSTNFAAARQEVFFPGRSLVIRKTPSIEVLSLGKSLGRIPLVFYLRAGAEGLSRADSVIETPRIVQRLDFHPRLALRLPSLAGFSIVPSAGIRETYYSARLTGTDSPEVVPTPLHRQYAEAEVEVRTPELRRDYRSSRFGTFSHLIEPLLTYRRIHGITELRETIRFDDEDAVADTNELEYGIVNRIIRRRETKGDLIGDYEFLSLRLGQKYYFDPTFGGAFLPGESNQFYPLNTLTGYSATGIERTLSPTFIGLRLTPAPGISYDLRADYDTRLHRLRDSGISAMVQKGKLLVASTYLKTNSLESGMFQANHIQGQIGYGSPNRGFSASLVLSYDLQSRKLLNSNSRLNYFWNCCGVSLEFQQFDLNLRTESRITFSFNLKGIGNFGNLKNPESLF